jgi:hypothetical protein
MLNSEAEAMRDELVRYTAELDQIQSSIDEGRLLYADDPICVKELDQTQANVDHVRREIRIARLCIRELS